MTAPAQALRRAADWLEANPDKHIQIQLSNGEDEDPFDPKATCFCAYGRFLRELGPELWLRNHADRYGEIERETGVIFENVYLINDETDGERGNPAVIPYLRQLAEKLDE